MLKPVPMTLLRVLALERDRTMVLRELGRLGVVELMVAGDSEGMTLRSYQSETDSWSGLLSRAEALRRLLRLPPSTQSSPVAPGFSPLTLPEAEERLADLEHRSGQMTRRRDDLLKRWNDLSQTNEQLAIFRGTDVPIDWPVRCSFLHFVIGTVPADQVTSLQQRLPGNGAVVLLGQRQGRHAFVATSTVHERTALNRVLERSGFQPQSFPPDAAGTTIDEWLRGREIEAQALGADLSSSQNELEQLTQDAASSLDEIERSARFEKALLEAEQSLAHSKSAVLLAGWVATDSVAAVSSQVRQMTGGRCMIETVEATEARNEQVPVLLRHGRLLRPFEMLIKAYGLPLYHELEPTIFVAISYVLMFGIMFGDVGHGIILGLAGLGLLLRGRSQNRRDGGMLLLFAAGSSIVFGALYGSFFGLPAFKKLALWRDPLEGNPLLIMYGAVGFGVILISIGLILNTVNHLRRADIFAAIFDKFGVLGGLFYWGSLALIVWFAAFAEKRALRPAFLLIPALPLVGWTLKKPLEALVQNRMRPTQVLRAFAPMAVMGLIETFEAMLSYLANTISFVRLAAYAMSHAAILAATVALAQAFKHAPMLAVTVIILGNAAAILIEGVVASVQALRLEYYEFFGKFFSGAGRPFRPFQLLTSA